MLSITGAMGLGPNGSVESFEDKVQRTLQKLALLTNSALLEVGKSGRRTGSAV